MELLLSAYLSLLTVEEIRWHLLLLMLHELLLLLLSGISLWLRTALVLVLNIHEN